MYLLIFIQLLDLWQGSRGFRFLAARSVESSRSAYRFSALRLAKAVSAIGTRFRAGGRSGALTAARPVGECWFLGRNVVPRLEPILKKLARAQDRLLRAADAVPAVAWKTSARPGTWSAAELIEQRNDCGTYGCGCGRQNSPKTAQANSAAEAIHLPFILAEVRLVRMKSPIQSIRNSCARRNYACGTERGPRSDARTD